MSHDRPNHTIRDGALKATVWRNDGENGAYFRTTLSRTYQDEQGQLHDTNSFADRDLLRVAELAREAHAYTKDQRREQNQQQTHERETPQSEQRREAFKNERQSHQNPARQDRRTRNTAHDR